MAFLHISYLNYLMDNSQICNNSIHFTSIHLIEICILNNNYMNHSQDTLEFLCRRIDSGIEKGINQIEERFKASNSCPELRRLWIPRDEVKLFFGYADTQLSVITKQYGLVTTEIGRRKFYSTSSLLEALSKK